ncbi:MAG TPA: phosphoribosyltransferase family protein [Candidatus Saccharimonadales bacterium]|nr:phosphoribosyltransferase family protein [Candidatus Saccharimonadales bacterium]
MCSSEGVCKECQPPFSRAWYVGERADELLLLTNDYKFQRKRAASRVLADLLFQRIGILPEACSVVPIPSNPAHIRQRGYDHTYLIARQLAKLNNRKPERLLERRTHSVQTGKTKRKRSEQAALAFAARGSCENKTILIVDDIVTTGATIKAAARLLREAGATDVWVAAIARQPLD